MNESSMEQFKNNAPKRGERMAAELYIEGMDKDLLPKLNVYEGSLEPLTDSSQHAIALAAYLDDSGKIYNVPKGLGDTLTVTYVEEAHWYDRRTGELADDSTPEEYIEYKIVKSHDITYTVCALVGIPYNLSYRFGTLAGFDAVITADALKHDSNQPVGQMIYVFDTPNEAAEAKAESWLADYTADEHSEIMYESKALLRAEFENFQTMFLLVGSALCIIVGLVGILNFFNAILTGILTRHREFAMLQSVGMTGRQLMQMLVYEGIFYAAGAGILTLFLSLILNPLVGKLLEKMFWFFSYHFTILPVLIVIPVFVLLGVMLPLMIYKFTAKKSIVERLRETE